MLDRLAVFLSGVCMLHCLLAPTLVSLMPVLGLVAPGEESFHLMLLFLVLPTSIAALVIGYQRHRDMLVPALGMAGLSLIITAVLTLPVNSMEERLLTSVGGVILALSHFINFRRCRPLQHAG